MTFSLHQASAPVYARLLDRHAHVLDKAAAHAEAAEIAPAVLLNARLFPDMWPLKRQVQAATGHAVRGVARPAGIDLPQLTETSTSFADLKQRIGEALAFIESVDPAAIDAGTDRAITFPVGDREETLTGRDYVLGFSMPNFYFHLTTAYNILRANGVSLNKIDFMGPAG